MDWGAWWARVRGSQSQTRLSDGGHIHTDVCHSFPSKEQASLISWLQSLSTVILEPKKIVCHCFQFFPLHFPWSDATRCHDLSFLMLSFKPAFHSPSSRGSLVPLHFLPLLGPYHFCSLSCPSLHETFHWCLQHDSHIQITQLLNQKLTWVTNKFFTVSVWTSDS